MQTWRLGWRSPSGLACSRRAVRVEYPCGADRVGGASTYGGRDTGPAAVRVRPRDGPCARGWRTCRAAAAPAARAHPHGLDVSRAEPLTIPATVYGLPADPWVIKTYFESVLRLSNAIADPVERAFFVLTHPLYLLPFEQCNATLALLTMNVPLIAAGLRPITFAAVPPDRVLAGLRAGWELNRTELLRDAFVGAV